MKKLITVLIFITLLLITVSCTSEEIEGAPDDIVFTPGGLAYRANVHAAGKKNPWPDIESKKVVLGEGLETARVSYRDYIETKAGETRNNLFYLSIISNGVAKSINDAILEVREIPHGIQIEDGEKSYQWDRIDMVIVIEVSQQAEPGEYGFEVGVNIDGEDYGKVPCIIKVLEL